MSTDFNYGGKQIVISGPIKPGGKDMPSDARTRVESYVDIASIPNPHVGLKITVKVDETNNNKMTDYIVKSLKANSAGVANTLIDEVVRYVDYLGANSGGGSSSGTGSTIDTSNLASDLSLTGSNLQLKNSSGSLIGTAITLPTNSTNVPTKTSELTNDSGFATTSYVDEQIAKIEISGGSSELANLLIVI